MKPLTIRKQVIPVIACLFLISIGYTNCSRPAFRGENNTLKTENTSTVGNPKVSAAGEILTATCEVISKCHPEVTSSQCAQSLAQTSGFGSALGLSSDYDTIQNIQQAELTGTLSGNESATTGCISQIASLSCSTPEVQDAYQPTVSNPFAAATKLASSALCNQTYVAGANLEVPIELVDVGLSSRTTAVVFSRTRTSLQASDYNGAVTYFFEVTVKNTDASSRNISLVDSSGIQVATIAVGPGITEPTRLRVPFTPSGDLNNYRLELAGTQTANQLQVFTGRVLVRQIGATQTRIYVPLVGGYAGDVHSADDATAALDRSFKETYAQSNPHYYGLYRKNSSAFNRLADIDPWTFEAVLSVESSGDTAHASLVNANTGRAVASSELTTTSTAPALVSTSFSDSAADFTDLDMMEARLRRDLGSSNSLLYRAGLWIRLTHLSQAEVYYRNATTIWQNTSSEKFINWAPVLFDPTAFSKPLSAYAESTGYVSAVNAPCSSRLVDIGNADFAITGTNVTDSVNSFTATSKSLKRSLPVSLTAGHRFISEVAENPLMDTCVIPQSLLVIGF